MSKAIVSNHIKAMLDKLAELDRLIDPKTRPPVAAMGAMMMQRDHEQLDALRYMMANQQYYAPTPTLNFTCSVCHSTTEYYDASPGFKFECCCGTEWAPNVTLQAAPGAGPQIKLPAGQTYNTPFIPIAPIEGVHYWYDTPAKKSHPTCMLGKCEIVNVQLMNCSYDYCRDHKCEVDKSTLPSEDKKQGDNENEKKQPYIPYSTW